MNSRNKLAVAIAGEDQATPAIRPSASTAVLLLLGVIGASVSGVAEAVPMVGNNCVNDTVPGSRSSAVLDAVEASAPGTFDYGFRVCNTTFDGGEGGRFPAIRDWELPFFGTDLDTDNEAGIADIAAPAGWLFELEEIGVADPGTGWDGVALWQQPGDDMKTFFDAFFGGEANNPYNFHTHVLHFYTPFFEGETFCDDPIICTDDSLDGFGFTASFDETNAPYQASWAERPVQTGDPAFPLGGQPNSPTIQNALNVPEPGTLALLAAGGLLMGASRLRKRKPRDED